MISRREKFIVLAISFAFSFLLYGNSLNGDFVFDDKLVILQNPLVSGNFSDFFRAFSSPYYHNQTFAGLYRPLTIVSFNLNQIFSHSPSGYHLINIIFNAVNGFLVFIVVCKFINKKAAYIAMMLFIFLPIHTEAISSIVGRGELLVFLFSVLSLVFVLNKKYAWASVLFLLALLSKETAAGFFLVFLFLWKFQERKNLRQIFNNSLYFVPPIAIYAIMRASVLGKYFISADHLMVYNPLKFASFFDSLWTSLKVFYLYVFKTVVPYQLSSDYSFNQIPIIQNPFLHYEVYAGITILAAVMYLAIKRKNTIYGLAAAIFLLTYLPISNWLFKTGTIMGERLMYAPSLGLVILVALWTDNLKFKIDSKFKIQNSKLVYIGLVILLSWYGYVIIDRNRDWKNDQVLLKSGYGASPNSVVSLTNMGILAFGESNYREAIEWSEKALEILPDHVPALFLIGHAYKNLGDVELAERYWLRLQDTSPNYIPNYLSLGILYYEQGKLGKAEAILVKGFELEKTWGKAFPLILVKINLGKYDEAIKLITNNFGSEPQKQEIKFALGLAYLKKEDNEKAKFYLNQVKEPGISIEEYIRKVKNQKTFKISEY